MFSRRTSWEASANELTALMNSRRSAGATIIDLTVSNPTTCGFTYPGERILRALSSAGSLSYHPDPRGLSSARGAVASYYRNRGRDVSTDDIFLTASTSESYSLLFTLLCDPGDAVLVPRPSYPLFEYLSGLNGVRTIPYQIVHDHRWKIDTGSMRSGLAKSPRAVVVVNPHTPTGSFVREDDWREISGTMSGREVALIVDEVFIDYAFNAPVGIDGLVGNGAPVGPVATGDAGPPAFFLNGLSKSAGLPQMKLGWIVVTGGGGHAAEARTRLEILNDIYLSAGTPAQAALPELLACGEIVRPSILQRVSDNYAFLCAAIEGVTGASVPETEGGWNAVVRLPEGMSDEECSRGLLKEEGVYCYPGFFFDFEENNMMILSLLPLPEEFGEGVGHLARWIAARA